MELTSCSLLPLTHHGLSIQSKWEFAMDIATPHAPMQVLASYKARFSNVSAALGMGLVDSHALLSLTLSCFAMWISLVWTLHSRNVRNILSST